jgi:hypothetical protein
MVSDSSTLKLWVRHNGDTSDSFVTGCEGCATCDRQEILMVLLTSWKWGLFRRVYCRECWTNKKIAPEFLVDTAPSHLLVAIVAEPPTGARLRLPQQSQVVAARGLSVWEAATTKMDKASPELVEDTTLIAEKEKVLIPHVSRRVLRAPSVLPL